MSLWKRLFRPRPRPNAEEIFEGLRSQMLTVLPDALGLHPTPTRSDVWAVLMDWNVGNGIATVVAVADGTVSLYLSSGGGVIGAGAHEAARRAGEVLLDIAQVHHKKLAPATAFPLPARGHVCFHVRTFADTRSGGDASEAMKDAQHELAPLFAAAQEVLTALRERA